jgi:hypothetical protein
MIPKDAQEIKVIQQAVRSLLEVKAGVNPRFVRLGECLSDYLEQFPASFRLSCDPQTELASWEGALWRPEVEADDTEEFVNGMEAFFSVLFPLARRLKLDIYDAMLGVYLPARGLALPRDEEQRYRLDFDPDAAKEGNVRFGLARTGIPG